MTGDSDGGVNGFGGDRADVGFIGEGSNMFFLPGSNTGAVLELDTTTNVGVGGVWIFEVGTSVERPCEFIYIMRTYYNCANYRCSIVRSS